jgi:hypothetical protein
MSIHAGGAITGIRSTVSAEKKTARYIHIAVYLTIQGG